MASPPLWVWGPWWFSRSWLSIFTIPLFLFRITATYSSAKGGIILWLAFGRVTYAVYGGVAGYLAFSTLWPLALLPACLCYSLLKNTPGLWRRRDVQMRTITKLLLTAGSLILLLALAQFLTAGESAAVAWAADQNPCAAANAGVTGNQLPHNCFDGEHAALQARLRQRWLLVEPPVVKSSTATFVVDSKAPLQNWTVEDNFASLEACHAGLARNRAKPPSASDLAYFPPEARESLTDAVVEGSRHSGCAFGASSNTPIQ